MIETTIDKESYFGGLLLSVDPESIPSSDLLEMFEFFNLLRGDVVYCNHWTSMVNNKDLRIKCFEIAKKEIKKRLLILK